MNKLHGILALLFSGALLFSACDKAESDVMPEPTGEIILHDDYYSTSLRTPIALNILANDTITIDGELTIDQPENGELIADEATGMYIYKPTTNHKAQEELRYTVCNNGDCKEAFIKIRVVDVAQCEVVANPDFAVTNYQTDIRIDVIENDKTCGRIALLLPNQTMNGFTVLPGGDGRSFIFRPVNPTIGTARFYYNLCGNNSCDTAWVNVKVDGPITANCNFVTRPDIVHAFDLPVGAEITFSVTDNDEIYNCNITPTCTIYAQGNQGEVDYAHQYGDQYVMTYKRLQNTADSDIIKYEVCKTINGQQVCLVETVTIEFYRPDTPE